MKIDKTKIYAVHNGPAGGCLCGCEGKMYYASAHAEWAGKARGWPVAKAETNDLAVVLAATAIETGGTDYGDFASYTNAGRQVIAYFKPEEASA